MLNWRKLLSIEPSIWYLSHVLCLLHSRTFYLQTKVRLILQSNELVEFVIEKIEDLKGRDIVTIDVQQKSSITDYMVICSGNSKRHVQSIADSVYLEAKKAQLNIIGIEGKEHGEWVLVDLGSVIVHVMQESTRDFYH